MRAQKRGAKVIVVDPRDIQIAKLADLHLQQRPGTDVAWLNGMMHVIIEEGLYDQEFVEERTEGFEELKAAVADYTPERVEEITGIPAADLVAGGADLCPGRARRPSSTPWASPSTPPASTMCCPAPTWPCSPATWASRAPASTPCAGRTTCRAPATWAACPTSTPATRR